MDLRVGEGVKSLRLGVDSLLGFIGFSTFVASFLGFVCLVPEALSQGPVPFTPFVFRLAAALTLLASFAVFHALAQRIAQVAGTPLLMCAAVGTCGCIIYTALLEMMGIPSGLFLLFYALSIIGMAASGCIWFLQLCRNEGKMVLGSVAVGVGVGSLICLGIGFMAPLAANVSLSICSLISLALAAFLMSESRAELTCRVENKVSDKRSRIKPVSTLMLSTSFFEFGFIASFATQTDAIWACACAAILASIILALDSVADGVITERSLSPLNPPLTVMAFLLLFMFGHIVQVIALCVVAMLSTVYITFGWAAMVQHVRLCKLAPIRVYAKARMANHAGFALGVACGYAAFVLPYEYGACLGVAFAGAFCLLSFFAHKPRFPESGFVPDEETSQGHARATWDQRCHAVGEKYELSERQQEVLALMAQGRNAKYIENALTISLSTVQTHIRNIYRKLGVHSRQELLDLIEEMKLFGED